MDETGLVAAAEAQRLGETVHVAALAGPALHRKTGRLVERDDVVVLPDHAGADHLGVRFGHARAVRLGRRRALGDRRQADGLAGLEAGRRADAAAVDADLALAAHALDPALRHLREAPAQPAVEPLVGLLVVHSDLAHAAHRRPSDP